MKTVCLFLACACLSFCPVLAQSSTDLSAQEIFDKVVQYYDPDGVWEHFEGSMHIYSIGKKKIGEEDLTLRNADDFSRSIKYLPDGNYAKGVKDGQVFFIANGQELNPEQVPEKWQKGPYRLNENSVRTFQEGHTTHFSLPLHLHASGAQPLPEVTTKTLFGTECLAITFARLPDAYKKGWFKDGPITLYIDPANNYRIHATHTDNGWWKDGKGVLALMAGELEIGGLKIPARKLYFDAANHNFRLMDAFSTDTRF